MCGCKGGGGGAPQRVSSQPTRVVRKIGRPDFRPTKKIVVTRRTKG